MTAELHHWPLTIAHPNLGPGWAPMWERPGTDDAAIADEIVIHDEYRLRGLDLSPQELSPGNPESMTQQVVIDCGANIGFFTMTCVRMGARVIAVEPVAENLELLRANVGSSQRHVRIIEGAVGDHHGHAYMLGTAGTAHVSTPIGITQRVEVEQFTLTEILEPLGRVAILKLDVEGAEADVLLSTPHAQLAKCDRIMAEMHGPPMCAHVERPRWGEIVEWLAETHSPSLIGRPSEGGGMLFAHANDR
jgi:FkbM family methyltransferase